jgi:hypothetical protein
VLGAGFDPGPGPEREPEKESVMESQIPLSFRDLDSLRRGAVMLREREDREAAEYQSTRERATPGEVQPPLPVDVITGRAIRTASAAN